MLLTFNIKDCRTGLLVLQQSSFKSVRCFFDVAGLLQNLRCLQLALLDLKYSSLCYDFTKFDTDSVDFVKGSNGHRLFTRPSKNIQTLDFIKDKLIKQMWHFWPKAF